MKDILLKLGTPKVSIGVAAAVLGIVAIVTVIIAITLKKKHVEDVVEDVTVEDVVEDVTVEDGENKLDNNNDHNDSKPIFKDQRTQLSHYP